jgi:hypothetical protein
MPQVTVVTEITDDEFSYSETQYKQGLVELLEFEFDGLNLDADVNARIYALMNPEETNEELQIWRFRYSIASVDSSLAYVPVLPVTVSEGEAGITGGAHIPLRTAWRLRFSGATQGTIKAYVSFDQG